VSARGRKTEREKYISKVGYLYPDRNERLSSVQDFKSLVSALEASPYEAMLKQVSSGDDGRNEAEVSGATIGKYLLKDLVLTINVDEVMLVESSRRFSMAFEDGFHYGCFYAYLKLKEQEIANVTWLAELVTLQVSRQLPGWNKYVVPFKYHEDEVKRGNE
jgi:V-type H+-transporting ATPase subunit d